MKIQIKVVRESRWKIEMKKSQHKKVIKVSQKAKKWLNPKSESKSKKQRPLELRTLANQERFLLPTLGGPLLN